MKLKKDLKRIKQLALRYEDANWKFRRFLKDSEMPAEEIDAIVYATYQRVSRGIDCRQCANCCKETRPVLKTRDIKRFANAMGMLEPDFKAEYLEQDEEREGLCFRALPCPFLKDRLCTVYLHRPDDCRSYPHLDKKEFVFRLMQAISNCSVCPIVYNVFEELKRRLWRHGQARNA
jgi:Fe-S-cluster containining protein